MDKRTLKSYRQLLEGRLAVLLDTSVETAGRLAAERQVLPDPADQAAALSSEAFAARLRDRDRRLIRKIEEALRRIDAGEYGDCEACGEPISEARLKARPFTTLCIECKEEAERLERSAG
ncbi:MAG: RNA polymerase-binding protein DksA [Deltaproteobacteria bacterium]|nr:MAG: RNA polymerase-binding protein DksA [Deltaproteobacteria bacterium]